MKLKAVVNKLFTDRQVIISTRGQLKYLRLSVAAQAMGFAAAVGFGSMFAYLMVSGALQYREVTQQQAALLSLQSDFSAVSADFELAQAKIAATQAELDQQYMRLEDILADRHVVEKALEFASASPGDAMEKKSLEDRIRVLGESLHSTNERREQLELEIMQINKVLFQTARARDEADTDRQKTEQRLSSLRGLVNLYASTKDEIYKQLEETRAEFANLKQEFNNRLHSEDQLSNEVGALRSRLTKMSMENKDLIARIHDRTNESVMALREIIVLTGLDPEKLLGAEADIGLGGPFLAVTPSANLLDTEQDYYAQTQKMEASLARWESLQTLLNQLPLARPVDVGYITSSFGKRRDPMSKRTAFHSGVDIAGPKNSKVLATAPGVVTFAGRNGAYGNMVTIDHGRGFQTRYAHMKKVLVKNGQKIEYRTEIGVMGSTGRSTGRHVHYEIMYEGEHQDPVNFIKAGRYAFKATPKVEKAANE
ncbi:M23 family metallopeptidase [Sneathiella litorea]|uniref:Peptidoglycan DD-metalloendopeptidase family protein n=1 Tax=Sneathiella litorea TaxID=2606216 RepID=A0A6L8W8E5_9PROT|nr:M23 family metallopeptidase [Sneathiella litorea]MZR30939.1 peptidoglycan DD-metalloendopeptidase family protein [Sneathiella litorea]